MAKLRTYVHVKDDKGLTHVFGPDDVVPDWAEAIITNPKAWAEAPTVKRFTEPAPAKKTVAKRTPARRKAGGGDAAVHDG
ncbi:hypothetical protein [Streptomyces sp. NPDC002346]